ncbi:MAG: DUF4254 domain-containing protein [Bacteroidetes bacterium]|nr:DUF4254 domain-containing protein [Bacteroidota bacterium]
MINVNKILELQLQKVTEWHNEMKLSEENLPWKFIEENTHWNFMLWHEEDIARIKDIDPMRIVEAKRNIDKYNQARNNAMEKIDEWVLSFLESNQIQPGAKIHSETPGMMIDRLSIMTLKKYHMQEEVDRPDASEEHKNKCADRVKVLSEQMSDLSEALAEVFNALQNSTLRFKVYRQFKMYNDPSLNPQLYKRGQTEA